MNRKATENISKALPDFFKNGAQYLKSYFNENGQDLLDSASGTAGLIIKLFGQPLIDKYFENLSEKKLENFGLNTYIKAGIDQANKSLQEIEHKLDDSLTPDLVFDILNKSLIQELFVFDPNDVILIFQPKYHPAIVFVKKNYQRVLRELNANPTDVKIFLKNFNDNIEITVKKEFGSDYEKHLVEIEDFKLKDNETTFLWEMIQLGKIGFKETEDLKFEKTYAQWRKNSDLRNQESEEFNEYKKFGENNYEKEENNLIPIEDLISEYFNRNPNNHLEEILFVIADFGKGKSVFLKHYASKLAKQYLQTAEGYFPVYFNLRNFKNYSSDTKLGVISDYLQTKYSIKIDDEYFKNKKYFFLVDSLDESGELNKRSIDKVISSVKDIQGVDKTKFKTNRIMITSRPFDEGLSNHLNEHNPYIINNEEGREIPYFINIYGFTKIQFNDWLYETLKTFSCLEEIKPTGFAKEIIEHIKDRKDIDIYNRLLENKTLSRSELRRPIFAYMIYQLIINNVDFLSVGKIGVYLSFLNLLTKEAKHIHDVNYKVNLKEEFEFRNILHATSALWMYERQNGKQGALKKSDICRVLEGKDNNELDSEILERFKGRGLTEIQFLSHSYFGDNDNVLHFQHQSFAEILLAEYYLKVFIKYALDKDSDAEEARVKLILGEPTEQTILFFKEMLLLLRDTAVQKSTSEIIEKRKLLFPVMASLASEKHNRLFCNSIHYGWFEKFNIEENQTEFPYNSLKNWCIDNQKIEKIVNLASEILNSKTNYLLTKVNSKTALFNNEVIAVQNQRLNNLLPDTDRWLALVVGNALFNDLSNPKSLKFFNRKYNIDYSSLFDLIKNWNFSHNDSAPSWGKDLFIGINMQSNISYLDLNFYNFDGLDFSHSYLKGFRSWSANWSRCRLNSCTFNDIHFITSLFLQTSIKSIKKIIQPFTLSNCQVSIMGFKLLDALNTADLTNFRREISSKIPSSFVGDLDVDTEYDIFNTMSGVLIYGLQKSLFTFGDLEKGFEFENEETKTIFLEKLEEFKKYEVIKKK
jgi:hypothetical protein